MSYVINKTNGEVLTTLLDGTTNTETGLTLIGRNYPTYGEIQNENFVRLLENFSSDLPPGQSVGFAPISGQLWWDSANKRLRVYDAVSGEFLNVSERYVAATSTGIVAKTGDQWFNTGTNQLFSYTGSAWHLIGPIYTTAQGISGEVTTSILDSTAASHVAVQHYSGGTLIGISSADAEYQPIAPITGFGNISPGFNLKDSTVLNGTANNSVRVGGLYANVLARIDVDTTFTANVGVNGILTLTNANVSFNNNSLNVQNLATNGNVAVYVTSGTLGNVNALTINGTDGLAYISGNPTSYYGVASKGYVDLIRDDTIAELTLITNETNANVQALYVDYIANVNLINATMVASINNLHSLLDSNIAALSLSTDNRFGAANAIIATHTTNISDLFAAVALRANIASPTFTGTVRAPTPAPNANSNVVATTAYVDSSANVLTTDYTTRISALATVTATNLANGLALKANIDSPALTGVPTSITPAAGDNSTKIATTAFVQTAITTNKFNYSVATTTPGDTTGLISSTNNAAGNDGDFWFQIG